MFSKNQIDQSIINRDLKIAVFVYIVNKVYCETNRLFVSFVVYLSTIFKNSAFSGTLFSRLRAAHSIRPRPPRSRFAGHCGCCGKKIVKNQPAVRSKRNKVLDKGNKLENHFPPQTITPLFPFARKKILSSKSQGLRCRSRDVARVESQTLRRRSRVS